jgi:hypothetical protein
MRYETLSSSNYILDADFVKYIPMQVCSTVQACGHGTSLSMPPLKQQKILDQLEFWNWWFLQILVKVVMTGLQSVSRTQYA